MTTWTALTTLPDEAAARSLGAALEDLPTAPCAVAVLEVEDGSGLREVGGYFQAAPDEVALDLLAAAHGARPFAVARLEDRDWVAQVRRELTPVEAGRFVVHGGHDRAAIGINRIGLEIEAAMAFGTGHHGTTRGCLLALDRLAKQGVRAARVADVGCGTGVLGMAAAALWHGTVVATDIDPVAAATARANARANRVGPSMRVGRAAGFRSPLLRDAAPFDLVLANILARPLRRLAPDMARMTRRGGRAVLSGILTPQAAGVEATYRGWGFSREARIVQREWTTLLLRRV